MQQAGRSARAEYQRRRARDRVTVRRNLKFTIPIILITPVATYLLVRWGVNIYNSFAHRAVTASGHQSSHSAYTPAVSKVLANDLAVVLVIAATVALATDFWGRRSTTQRL